jgi:HAD superfamily hydrolase (TIGR01490 family)
MPADILALFDLDNTLLQHDSDEQWVAFLIEKGELDGETFKRASDELAARYRRGEADTLEYTEFYLSTLCDRPLGELQALHDRFMDERIRPVVPAATRELVAHHRNLGHLCVLTTATSRFLTAPIARELGFEHLIATEPELVDGHYTGRVIGQPNMREGKVERLAAWLEARGSTLADFRESWFYSDSQNDLPLLTRVTHPVAVNPDAVLAAHARHKGWPQIALMR